MDYQLLSSLYYTDEAAYLQLYRARFESESTWRFDIKIHNHPAFCCLTAELVQLLTAIAAIDKKIYTVFAKLPSVAIKEFAQKCLVDEILLTNDIEGVYSTRKEITRILIDTDKAKSKRFYGLVAKYIMLGKAEIPLKSCEDIRSVYNELVLPEVVAEDPQNAPDGNIFRNSMAEVTTATQTVIHKGVYPEAKIVDCMQQALQILNNDNLPLLIRVAVFHYLFGYIHPFYDGNGRTSRFISSYLLSENFEWLIGYRLSYTIKENINDYYKAFKICNDEKNKGDLTPFVTSFLRIVKKSFDNLYDALNRRYDALKKYSSLIQTLDVFSKEEQALCNVLLQGSLFSKLGVSKKDLCQALNVSMSTVDKRLKIIDNAGFLTVRKNGQYKYYSLVLDALT